MYEESNFFSYNKLSDWMKGISNNLQIEDKGLSIKQTMKYSIYDSIYMGNHVGIGMICDFTVGKDEQLYLLDEASSIWTYDYRNNHLQLLIHGEQQLFTNKASLSTLGDLLFIAEPTGQLIAYSIINSQIMWIRSDWQGQSFHPLSITTQSNTGKLYILIPTDVEFTENGHTYIPSSTEYIILSLNMSGEVTASFRSKNLSFNTRRRLLDIKYQLSILAANDDRVYIFQKETNKLYCFDEKGFEHPSYLLMPSKQVSGICVDSNNRFYLGDSRNWNVVGEDDRFIVSLHLDNHEELLISSYRGRVDKMVIDRSDRIFIWDGQQKTLAILSLKQRTQERNSTQLLEGVFISTALDTKVAKTKWHKVLVDIDLPKETKMLVSYFTADDKRMIVDGKQVNIDELLFDESLSFNDREEALQSFWQHELSNPQDALLFHAEGRFLWFKIKLIGSEKQTPILKKIRLYFPRTSYLSYLPAFYQEDKTSSEFLERFLSLFSKFLTEMDEKISEIPNYFDPNLVSGEFLKWLSQWLGISADDSWDDTQLRAFIQHAPYLYKKRGTKEAISKMIEIYTGEAPLIIEHFQLKSYKKDAHLHEVIKTLYGDNPYYFYVLMKSQTITSEKERIMVQNILDAEKPAFTEAKLIVLEPWIYLDMQTYLEINTYLSERSLMTLNDRSYMPTDTVLIDLEQDTRIDTQTRMDFDSKLK